ncbi:hypothetical protein [Crenobacter intestini]|uniref:Peptidase C39-like domain-containing protein n=1 Tax=Crenobacter intestini TaxID=2563443 RepID=A0A4T0UNN7_9NEIS|nr:hypothetical protein [Crenobacter intestini]TIC80328.1 hypothetical protein E5K04_12550 [Crenobacter intestini]
MNTMMVSPLLRISESGPVSVKNDDRVHLRQGELDGACGPYCMVSALIALDKMRRERAQNMDQWDGRTREGRFRDALMAFGTLNSEGTSCWDLVWLTDYFKNVGLQAAYVEGSKKTVVNAVSAAVANKQMPILAVDWQGGGAHWLLVVGCQGVRDANGTEQLTHLLCLDPGYETTSISLWNVVIEVFKPNGDSANQGYMSSNHWDASGRAIKCQIRDAVILSA